MSGVLTGWAFFFDCFGATLALAPKAMLERTTVSPLPGNINLRVPRIAGYLLLILSAFLVIFEFVSE